MATEIAKAYVQIVPSFNGVAGEISKGFDGAMSSSGTAQSVGSKIGGAFTKGLGVALTAVGTAVAGATAAIGALASQSLNAYADFEQLSGGIETLFGEAVAPTMMESAQDAFRTVGMSANEYMETVTGFSASLISSLGGDTVKAAEYADRALTDMSDNANKMGTDLESIKNAYGGFAKQNYTMLD